MTGRARTDHGDERVRRRDVSVLRVERKARGLEDPEHEHTYDIKMSSQPGAEEKAQSIELTDRGRDEQRPPSDLVADEASDDRDYEVVDVEDPVLCVHHDGSRRVCGRSANGCALTMRSCVVGSVTAALSE